ncbi:MAG: hypothetical protein U5R46_17725 [Gammaproteobacteria bacterium]|nr:hypothetical protein [Gammaproteobacteria bacterium]
MGVLASLFGGKLNEQEQVQGARALLDEARSVAALDPEKAIRKLRRDLKRHYQAVTFDGLVHAQFRELVQPLLDQAASHADQLPSVRVTLWSTWNDPMIGDLTQLAADMKEDVLYCKAPAARGTRDAVAELEALDTFARNDQVAMIVIGEEDMLFRRSFLVEAAGGTDPQSEDVGQDLADFATKRGLKTESY